VFSEAVKKHLKQKPISDKVVGSFTFEINNILLGGTTSLSELVSSKVAGKKNSGFPSIFS
jgi:hypothetical protein